MKHRERTWEALSTTCLFFLSLVLFLVMYLLAYKQAQCTGCDMNAHALSAQALSLRRPLSWIVEIGHPLWHLCVTLLLRLGIGLAHAAALVTAVAKTAQMLLIWWFYRWQLGKDYNGVLTSLLAFATVIVSAIRVASINPHVYQMAGSPNPWHSPTQTMMYVWMLMSILALSISYDQQRVQDSSQCILNWGKTAAFSAVLLCSALAKPVFVQCFFPAAGLYFLVQWIRHPRYTRYFCRLLVSLIPTIVLMLMQLNTYFGARSASGIGSTFIIYTLQTTWRTFLLMNAFPLFVLIITYRQKSSTLYWLTLLTNLCAFAERVLLTETGMRSSHGNWGWALLAASLLLWVLTVPRYAKYLFEKHNLVGKICNVMGFALLLYHILSGLYYVRFLLIGTNSF